MNLVKKFGFVNGGGGQKQRGTPKPWRSKHTKKRLVGGEEGESLSIYNGGPDIGEARMRFGRCDGEAWHQIADQQEKANNQGRAQPA